MPDAPLLAVTDLALARGDRALFGGLSFDLHPGDALWLTGPNGSGKTSLLLALAGLIAPEAGGVLWREGIVPGLSGHRGPERDGLTLGEELRFWQRIYRDTRILEDRLDAVGLTGMGSVPVAGLSAGQKRRLGLARLQSANVPVWLMDEPMAGLDAQGRTVLADAVSNHLAGGGAAIIASHRPVPLPDRAVRRIVLEAVAA